jgi:hypothetical protein
MEIYDRCVALCDTDTSWALNPLGTVTSVAASVPSFLSIAGSPITTSGTLAISLSGTALPTTSGGTGLTSFTANGVVYASSSSALATGSALTYNGSTFKVAGTDSSFIAGFSGTTKGVRIETTATGSSIAGVDSGLVTSFQPLDINGSYVAFSTSSAERMRLSASGLAIGTGGITAGYPLDVRGGATEIIGNFNTTGTTAYTPTAYNGNKARIFLSGGNATGATNGIQFTSSGSNENYFGTVQESGGAGAFVFQGYNGLAYLEKMRISAIGYVGIGTDNPTEKLVVNGNVRLLGGNYLQLFNSANSSNSGLATDATGLLQFSSTSVTRWLNNTLAVEQMRLDASGNLGLGVTPSAWGSVIRALQVNNTGLSLFTYSAAGTVDQYAFLGNNSFQNSGYAETYVRTNPAAQYRQLNATHAWLQAASGTAGTAVTFTQAMTLAASGGLSVGTTTDAGAGNILVNGLGTFTATTTNGARALKLIGRPTTNDSQIGFFSSDGTTSQGFFNSSASKLSFYTASSLESVIFLADGRLRTISTISVGDANPSTSGAGITFPATQNASSDANTLDDYEEGTWTPTQGAGLTVVGTFSSNGHYIKIGRQVTITGYVAGSTTVTVTGNTVICQGLPFRVMNVAGSHFLGGGSNAELSALINVFLNQDSFAMYAVTTMSATPAIYFTATYFID